MVRVDRIEVQNWEVGDFLSIAFRREEMCSFAEEAGEAVVRCGANGAKAAFIQKRDYETARGRVSRRLHNAKEILSRLLIDFSGELPSIKRESIV